MKCTKCGNNLQQGGNFCEYCGAKIPASELSNQRSAKSSPIIIPIISIVAILIFLAIVFFSFKYFNNKGADNSVITNESEQSGANAANAADTANSAKNDNQNKDTYGMVGEWIEVNTENIGHAERVTFVIKMDKEQYIAYDGGKRVFEFTMQDAKLGKGQAFIGEDGKPMPMEVHVLQDKSVNLVFFPPQSEYFVLKATKVIK